ncbi:unnamed protein product [Sympodiomycopsis kandeliae]
MKFSKTYLQTMTDPSFPQEWRDKGLEYKELKKLINGVVAELESLGLSADVLRELLEPPEQQQKQQPQHPEATSSASASTSTQDTLHRNRHRMSHRARSRDSSEGSAGVESDTSEDLTGSLVAGLARLSTGRPAPSEYVDPLSPLMEDQEARTRQRERSMLVPPMSGDAMPAPMMETTQSAPSSRDTDSPAGEWLSHIRRSRRHRNESRSPSNSRKASSQQSSSSASANGGSSRETSAPPESIASPDDSMDSQVRRLRAQGNGTEFLRASPMTMLGIRKSRDESQERQKRSVSAETDPDAASSSAVLDGEAHSPETSWRLGRKDLEELRRNSHTGGRSSAMRPSFSAPHAKRRASGGAAFAAKEDSEDDERHDWGGMAWRERQSLGRDASQARRPGLISNKTAPPSSTPPIGSTSDAGVGKGRWVQGKDGRRARAEYELAGTTHHPIPRIRLIIESPVNSDDESGSSDDDDGSDDGRQGGDDHFKMEEDDDGKITELPPSLPGSRRASRDLNVNSAGQQGVSNGSTSGDQPSPRIMRTREIIIPLTADTQFLDTLTASLEKLSELQGSQKDTFVTSTEDLCASVARASSPYASKNDLYVWREIFQLWVDMQIFESQREKDRGELSVDESEARLKRFAEELKKRGWLAENSTLLDASNRGGKLSRNKKDMEHGLTLPMKDMRSSTAVEDFLRLNLALLDVKKFQRVNVEAARKILKKHDKRTALTASSGLRDFVRQQEASRAHQSFATGNGASLLNSMGLTAEWTGTLSSPAQGTHPSLAALLPSSTTGLLSQSLPHILLSLLTTTLLPILPSVDDYSCSICTGLAWRPIRLDCSHLFCIRCLVKLQKAGKKDCPLCRSKNVVESADGRNLDEATVNMLKLWFPHEVDEKDKENESDRKKEELKELGFEENKKCCIM